MVDYVRFNISMQRPNLPTHFFCVSESLCLNRYESYPFKNTQLDYISASDMSE